MAAALALSVLVATGGAHSLIHGDERGAAAEAALHADADDGSPAAAGVAKAPGHDCSLHASAHTPLAAPSSCVVPAPAVHEAGWPAPAFALAQGRISSPVPRPPRA